MKNKNGVSTKCVHSGDLIDDRFKGATSPLFPSTAYDFIDVEDDKYPRYFNTPNQIALSKKLSTRLYSILNFLNSFMTKFNVPP